ncbi:hypothetical protein, partial [Nostoc sp. NMS4]|uniref:hypothetical protein n=1 Tax=Nostoc sp. NMS4 TaxID=2815390 RepID=UPI0025FE8755
MQRFYTDLSQIDKKEQIRNYLEAGGEIFLRTSIFNLCANYELGLLFGKTNLFIAFTSNIPSEFC